MTGQTILKALQNEKTRQSYKTLLLQLVLFLLHLANSYNLNDDNTDDAAEAILRDLKHVSSSRLHYKKLVDFLYYLGSQETKDTFQSYFHLDIMHFLIARSMHPDGVMDSSETISKNIAILHFIIRSSMLLGAVYNR